MDKVINIHNYLPHREPMLMVDVILSLTTENVKTGFEVKEGNIFIENGSFCEAGLIENAAQTCSAIVAQSYFLDEERDEPIADVIGFISSIKTIKIHLLPKTGSKIITKAKLISRFDTGVYTTCMMSCKSYCNDELLLEGEINLFIQGL
ncbi:ABC transporter permease [Flavobacterium sp. NRK1]|jgi:predicted hotdog family 3-hydroxylacyl-ACP dehydratase|uniref:ABC transporter permease n=1 Tax=Flavobacterium sp. NRK1 TaxID=2954929 RepID=UPI002092F738|nr:ABC transporter permease [Flavobacterium sp. NRK1]MCO6147292.1 ABC transporter permease [Flavobacterium sp. NRK1]